MAGRRHVDADGVAELMERLALCRYRLAGRRQSSVPGDQAGRVGDITLRPTTTSNDYRRWRHPRASGYTPSALVHDGRAYLIHDTGILVVLDAATGKEIYKARVGGGGHTFSASPVAAGSRCCS